MKFSEMMRDGRDKMGLTLAEASSKIGISIGYLSDFENDRAERAKMEIIYNSANLYGINVDELCLAAGRIPKDIYYKIVKHPYLIGVIRKIEV